MDTNQLLESVKDTQKQGQTKEINMRNVSTKFGMVASLELVISECYDPSATITRDTDPQEMLTMIEEMGNDYNITLEECAEYIAKL